MRSQEFKLRQKEMGKKPVPADKRETVKRLMREGVSRKVLCSLLNCTYSHLNECK